MIQADDTTDVFTGRWWSAPLFEVDGETCTRLDTVLFAMATGVWTPFVARLSRGLELVAEAAEHDTWPDDAALDAAANTFRYARDLLTAEETEAWLARAGIDVDAWSDALMRDLLRQAVVPAPDGNAPAALPAGLDDRTLIAELVCTGEFPRLAVAFAEAAAVAAAAGAMPHTMAGPSAADIAAGHAPWFSGRKTLTDRLTRIAAIVAADAVVTAAAVTPAALETQLDRARLDWVRVDAERLTFPSAEAAREAVLCVREDGLTLSEVAIESRRSVDDERAVLDEIDPRLRDAVLSASPGDTLGPIDIDGRFTLVHIVAKTAPSLADPLVRGRAEAAVVAALRTRAGLARVRWVARPEP